MGTLSTGVSGLVTLFLNIPFQARPTNVRLGVKDLISLSRLVLDEKA